MKKNILTILILAATLVNLTLTAVCAFITIPTNKRMNNLIKDMIAMTSLELRTPLPTDDPSKITSKDKETIVLEEFRIKLVSEQDPEKPSKTTQAFVVQQPSIVLHTKAKDYEDVKVLIEQNESIVKDIIRTTVGSYTKSELDGDTDGSLMLTIKESISEQLRAEFDTACILDIVFSEFLAQ